MTTTKAQLIEQMLASNPMIKYTIRDLATAANATKLYTRAVVLDLRRENKVIIADNTTKTHLYQWVG